MADTTKLSASHIRCLLVMKSPEKRSSGVRTVDLALALGVSKPSAHTMLNTLCEMEPVCYGRYYKAVFDIITKYAPADSSTHEALCSLIAEVSEKSPARLCAGLKNETKPV